MAEWAYGVFPSYKKQKYAGRWVLLVLGRLPSRLYEGFVNACAAHQADCHFGPGGMTHTWQPIGRHAVGHIKAAYNEEMRVYVEKNTKVSARGERTKAADVALNAMQAVMRAPQLARRPRAATGSALNLTDARGQVKLQGLPKYKAPPMLGPAPGRDYTVKLIGVDGDDGDSADDYMVAGAKEREVQTCFARAERRKAKKPAPKPSSAAGGS